MAIHFGPKIMNGVRIRYCDPSAFFVRYRADNGRGAGGCGRKSPFKMPPEALINYCGRTWVSEGRKIQFNDYLQLFNWTCKTRVKILDELMPKYIEGIDKIPPITYQITIPHLIKGLRHINYSIYLNCKNWSKYVRPYEYLINDKDLWVYKGKDIIFTRSEPIGPIKWIVKNNPNNDKSYDFLFKSLRLCNRSIYKNKEDETLFAKYVSAYSYLLNLKTKDVRDDMRNAFNELIKEGKRPDVKMMLDKIDLLLYKNLKNDEFYLNIYSIERIIEIYLYFRPLVSKKELIIPEFE